MFDNVALNLVIGLVFIYLLYSLFATCKLHNVNPIEWLTYVFENINDHKINTIEDLLPQNYAALFNK